MAKRTASTRNDKIAFYQHNRRNPQKHRRLRTPKRRHPRATCTAQSDDETEQIMLPTAIVYVMDNESGRHEYRALLDQGSQVNVIKTSRSASTFLACRVEQSFLFSGPLTRVDWCASVRIEIASRCSGFHTSLSLIMDRWICPISSFQIPESAIHVPPHITLADPQFSIPRDVDLIIGNGQLCEIMSVGRHRLKRELPSLLKSTRWVFGGYQMAHVQNRSYAT